MSEMFKYEFEDGRKVEILPYKRIKAGVMRRNRSGNASDQAFSILEEVADEKTLEILDDQDQEQMNEFLQAWLKDSGVKVGESKASSKN